MLPAHRLPTSYDIDDRLIVAIIRHDLTTVRYILESHRYRSTINQSLYFGSCRNDFNHPITPLGIQISPINFSYMYTYTDSSSCCLSFRVI